MPAKPPHTIAVLALLAVVGCAAAQSPPAAPAATTKPAAIELRDILVIEPVGRAGRCAVHTDAIEAQLVNDRWSPPEAGQTLTLPDDTTRTWSEAHADEDGWIQHAAFRGGYAYASVESPAERCMILEASGHSLVYVNGQPRTGDPYKTGFVRLPVVLRRGNNELLFRCSRGVLRATLVPPRALAILNLDDPTVPDLVVGEEVNVWAAVVVLNTTGEPLTDASITVRDANAPKPIETRLPPIPPHGVRKVGIRIIAPAPTEAGDHDFELILHRGHAPQIGLDHGRLRLSVRQPDQCHRRTFLSHIDGSVQFYAVQPAHPDTAEDTRPALVVSLHGASVDAFRQARCYAPKTWCHVVAPTNRRPFGFDWEDWGRLDALEVLALAEQTLSTDPLQTYLTGHSMGGHGVWQVGATCPDRFAAIAPSAGWVSFWSYAGGRRFENPTPVERILSRAANPSDTLLLAENYLHHGVYVLHGDKDDNVPVSEARTMREHLAGYHANFAYYERPNAGHWWGDQCLDWPPLLDFLRQNTRPATHSVNHLQFVTANPAVSASCHWATIQQQVLSLEPSSINLHLDREQRCISGTTDNVAGLTVALKETSRQIRGTSEFLLEPGQPLRIEIDGQQLDGIPWPDAEPRVALVRKNETWQVATRSDCGWLGDGRKPQRGGPFKHVFDNRVQLVYGTHGTDEENTWALAKARYDAETFWYRGNGSFDVIADRDFDALADTNRNVVLYGNTDTNSAWNELFADCPVQVAPSEVTIGDRSITGDDLAVLAIHPRPFSRKALVGIVAGTGPAGMRLTDRLPYFVSGVAYPDWTVLSPRMLTEGSAGVRATGFFGNDWRLDPNQTAWQEP